MYMSLNDLRKKFATDQPFAIQFVADAADVGINVDILDSTGAQVDVITNKNGDVIGGKLYDDVNLLNTYIKVVNKITEEPNAIGQARLFDYLHAPFNEPDFAINTNTRVISIPSDFNRNGVGVVGDHLAEILFFTVPRFFDVVDLLDCTSINIYWYNNGLKGDSIVYHISTPVVKYAVGDTLYLGWAISENASVVAGSIEFFIEFEHVNTAGQVDFRLETQSAKIAIKPTLILDKNEVQRDSYNDIIHSRAIYSPIINSLTAAPAQIITNLQEGTIDDFSLNDGFAILSVNAISPDKQHLVYHWNWNGIMVDDITLINSSNLSSVVTYELATEKNVAFSDPTIYEETIVNENANPSELNLYIKDSNDEYILTSDTIVNNNTIYYKRLSEDNRTYRTLKTNVPGAYQVYIGNENSDGGIRYVYSATTIIEPASKIEIDNSQLPELTYLDWDNSVLHINVTGQEDGEVSYQWYHVKDNEEIELIEGATEPIFDPSNNNDVTIISNPNKRGYYYCEAINLKNNTKTRATSKYVMMENKPIALDSFTFEVDSIDTNKFNIIIPEAQTNMHYQMYAIITTSVMNNGRPDVKTYEIRDASKVFTGSTASFSISELTQIQSGAQYDIDCFIVPIAQYGKTFQRYAQTIDENGQLVPAYTRRTLSQLIK